MKELARFFPANTTCQIPYGLPNDVYFTVGLITIIGLPAAGASRRWAPASWAA